MHYHSGFGFRSIEDASHAVGASSDQNKVGSHTYSDIAVFSFHPIKIITSGEDGTALTNDDEFADQIRRLRTHGITSDPSGLEPRPLDEIWNYQQQH